jgi:tight adherence protein B
MTPDFTLTALIFAGAALCFGALVAIVTGIGAEQRAAFRRRLRRLRGSSHAGAIAEETVRVRRRRKTEQGGRFLGPISKRLTRAGLAGTSPILYLALCLLCGLGAGIGTYAILLMVPASIGVGLAVGYFLPKMVLGFMTSRRETRFMRQFPEAIDLIIRGVRSGYPVAEAIGLIADELRDPIGGEFRVVVERLRLGQSLEDALAEAAERIGLPDMRFFAVSLSVQHETGGNIAETLQNLADLLRQRQHMKLKVRALSSQARASAWIIGSLPFLVIVLMYFMNPEYLGGLLYDETGRMLLFAGIASQVVGVLVMGKMTRFRI